MPVQIFCLFLIGLFVCLLLSFEVSLYVLDISSLSDICLENMFAPGCLGGSLVRASDS